MEAKEFIWPEDETIVYLRPPNEEYDGSLNSFYSSDCFPELNVLKDNWKKIKDEILNFEKEQGQLKGMGSANPSEVYGGNWTVIYLMSFLRLFRKNRNKFPVTSSVLDKIPNCVFSAISVLPPNTEIAPHYGDTNEIVRCHLSLIVPDPYPTIGINVDGEEKGWEEGEILCFMNVHKHRVWSKSDKKRYVLMVDIVPKNLSSKKNQICYKGLGSQTYNYLYSKIRIFRKLPTPIHQLSVKIFTFIWRTYLPLQRSISFLP